MKSFIKRGRIVATFLLFLFIGQMVSVKAAGVDDAITTDMKITITDSMRRLTVSNNSYQDDRGAIYSLQSIASLAMWFEYACTTSQLGFSKSEMSVYYNHLSSLINTYNSSYSETTDDLAISSQLDNFPLSSDDVKGYGEFAGKVVDQSVKTLNEYAGQIIDILKSDGDYDNLNDDEKKEYLNTDRCRLVCKALFKASERINNEYEDILSIGRKVQDVYGESSIYSRQVTQFLNYVNNDEYSDFIDKGRDLVNQEIETNAIADDFVGNSAIKRYESLIDGEESATVNSHYYKCIAASSVYRPLESKVGEKAFIEALLDLDDADEVEKVYQDNCSLKKPLYKATSDGDKFVKAEKVTIKEFITDLKKGNSGDLVALKGKFKRNEDGDAFAYYDGKGQAIYQDTLEDASDDPNTTKADDSNSDDSSDDSDSDDSSDDSNSDDSSDDSDGNSDKTDDNNSDNSDDSNSDDSNSNDDDTYKSSNSTDNGDEFIPNETVTDVDKLSDSYFSYGYKGSNVNAQSVTNTMLASNILIDNKAIDSISNVSARYLYVNPFGDIVLDDDTVVIPASANATYYSSEDRITYNPNTAAFMNFYPTVSLNSKDFSASGFAGKFICYMKTDKNGKSTDNGPTEYKPSAFGQTSTGPCTSIDDVYSAQSVLYKISSNEESLKTWGNGYDMMPLEITMFDGGSDKIQTMRAMEYSFVFHWKGIFSATRTQSQDLICIVPNSKLTVTYGSTTNLFPLTGDETDSDFIERCKYIAHRYYEGMSYSKEGECVGHNERYDYQKMTKLFECALDGLSNINTYVKNSMSEYEDKEKDNVLKRLVKSGVDWLVSGIGETKGAIGVSDAYSSPIFSSILFYFDEFLPFILVAVFVYFIAKYSRRKVNIIYAISGIIFSMVFVFFFLELVPNYLPIAVNGLVNNTSDDLAYNSMFMRFEQYNNAYSTNASVNSDSENDLDSCSINLYRINDIDLDNFCSRLKIDKQDLLSDKGVILDADSGLFVKGDVIKISLDRVMSSLSIKGSYTNDDIQNQYSITSTKYISSSLDYYCPYYAVVDSFIDKLNKFSKLYSIPSSQVYYPSIKSYKDSFMVSSYVNSDLFLNGQDLTVLKDNFNSLVYDNATDPTMFGDNNIDWLGLNEVMTNYISDNYDKVKETLWYKTMERQGYYSKGDLTDEEGLSKIINNVNKVTKRFLVANAEELNYISDENLIKLISLYATCELDRELGFIDDAIYPESLNYEELTINDVLLPIVTTDYGRYVAANMDLSDYVNEEFNWIGSLLLGIDILLCWLIVNIMKYAIPVMYLILLLCIIYRFVVKKDEVKTAVWGYIKVFGSLCLSYMVFIMCSSFVKKFNDSVFILVILLLVYGIILSIMSTIIYALLISKFDFGSVNVASTIKRMADKTPLRKVFGKFEKYKRDRDGVLSVDEKYDKFNRYSFNTSLDDVYGEEAYVNMMNEKHDGMLGSYRRTSKPSRLRLVLRKNKKEYDDFMDDDRSYYDNDDDNDKYNEYKFKV